ncbi:MAG: N-formylglutamate amidohydrolase [Pseudomonadota bacterium]
MSDLPLTRHAYRLERPADWHAPVVAATPHSGRFYPSHFLRRSVLDERTIRSSEDAFVDLLAANAPGLGVPLLSAEYPRAFLDLNRGADELDPAVIEGLRSSPINPRISSGLGVVPRVVSGGRAIYRGKISRAEAEARIEKIWRPYHACLKGLMDEAHRRFGRAVLLDLHSMPHDALAALGHGSGPTRPDVVLGDRFGSSASEEIVELLERGFRDAGLKVGRNTPFAGAHIVQRYGKPLHGHHAVQIEIDRGLYMNEDLVRPNGNFHNIKAVLSEVLSEVVAGLSGQIPLAAE